MYIVERSRRNRSGSLYVFQFKNQEDFNVYINGIYSYFDNEMVLEELKSMVIEPLERLKARTDDKYTGDDYELSGCLFPDEMIEFVTGLSLIIAIKY